MLAEMLPAPELKWRYPGNLVVATLVALLLLTVRCDPTVDVLHPSDQYQYSLFGVLNVAADTQIVRVEPIGDSTQVGAPKNIDGTVYLENLDTGDRIALNDSFMTVPDTENRVHNFWTTHPLEPGTSYRILVERDGETITTATTVTPENAPRLSQDSTFYLPCSTGSSPEQTRGLNTFFVEVRDVERIAAADVIYELEYEFNQEEFRKRETFSHYEAVMDRRTFFLIPFFYKEELTDLNPEQQNRFQRKCTSEETFAHPYALVAVSAAGSDWPEWRGVPLNELARPDSFSNVEGGHGFVAGIYSDTIKVPIVDRPAGGLSK